ncbi:MULTISPECIES: hypothetical protein [Actinomadura]|uniref:Uncharacterized protein n=1 Tax=Actinomadura litoris TaxID=2678616 RepID=A0A7K1L3W3_9ACTN|nr:MULTISPECIES: hypothetical protein [Actinomadura]MBT2210077.1 hypothetical protein [Actinomadura sp. NEAU-AAG7]MUN39099.1 hypothetical protein [Actinomadura litoris]
MPTVDEETITVAADLLHTSPAERAEPSGTVAAAAHPLHRDALPPGPVTAVLPGGNV